MPDYYVHLCFRGGCEAPYKSGKPCSVVRPAAAAPAGGTSAHQAENPKDNTLF